MSTIKSEKHQLHFYFCWKHRPKISTAGAKKIARACSPRSPLFESLRRGGRLKSCHAEWNATKCKKELLAQIGNREVWNRKWTTESADTQGAQSWNAETQGGTKVETQQQHNFHVQLTHNVQLGRKCKSLKLSMYTCWDQVHYWGRIQNQGDHPGSIL